MSSLILLFLCLFLGILLRRFPVFPANAATTLNQFIIYITLPALSLYFIPEVQMNTRVLLPVGVAWLIFILSGVLFWCLGKIFNWPKKLVGCLILMSGLGNTAFIGYPLTEALYGAEGLKIAILVDQPGSFMAVSTLGIFIAVLFSNAQSGIAQIGRRIVSFPPFIAFVVAIVMNIMGFHFHESLKEVFFRLGSTVTPLALVSIGMQLHFESRSKHWRFLILGLSYKLLLAPAFIYLLYVHGFNESGEMVQISVLQAAMAPMITPSILAVNYGLKPRLANMMIGIGIPVSFVTLALWYWWIG